MNIKYKNAVEGRPDGDEILKNLGIQDSDRFDKAKLAAIEQTVKAMNEGANLKDAVNNAIAAAKDGAESTAITQKDFNAIASKIDPAVSDGVRKTLDGPLIEEGRQVVKGSVPKIAQSAQEAKHDVVGGINHYVKTMVYQGAQEAFESEEWQQAALEAIRGGKQ